MSLKRKLLGLAVLASLATAAFVAVTASANQEGHFATPGQKSGAEVFLVENGTDRLEYSAEGVTPGIVCNKTEWKVNTEKETEPDLPFFPKLEECLTTGGTPGSVKIKTNGCAVLLYAAKGTTDSTEQTADISCGVSGQMEITDLACTITIPSQTGLTGITYTKITFNGKKALTAHFNAKIAIKADGVCPKGITNVGKISGSAIIDAGAPGSTDLEAT